MEYDEQLEEYGILATNAKIDIKDNKITINNKNTKRAEIENIDCQKLQEVLHRESTCEVISH